MIGRLKCVRNGVKIFGRLSAREGAKKKRVWSAVFLKNASEKEQRCFSRLKNKTCGAGGQRSF